MTKKIAGIVWMMIVLGLVACNGNSSSTSNATIATTSDFVGTWKGSSIYSGGTWPTTLTLSSDLTGSYLIDFLQTYNLTAPGIVSNGTLSFDLPVSVENATNGCAAWAVSCTGNLSNVKTTLSLTCSGLLCSGTPYSYTDVMTKQ